LLEGCAAGTLPPSWGSLHSLTAISISNTSCSGPLPAEWGSPTAWQKLTILDLTYNKFKGAIPQSWVKSFAFPVLQKL